MDDVTMTEPTATALLRNRHREVKAMFERTTLHEEDQNL